MQGVFCRSRAWLFLSYVIAFSSVIGAVWVLLAGASIGTGVACLMQVLPCTPVGSHPVAVAASARLVMAATVWSFQMFREEASLLHPWNPATCELIAEGDGGTGFLPHSPFSFAPSISQTPLNDDCPAGRVSHSCEGR